MNPSPVNTRCTCGGVANPLIQGGRHTAFVFQEQISQVHVCESCSHVFFFPKPTERQLIEHYNGPWNAGSEYSMDFSYEAWDSRIDLPIHKPKAVFVETICHMREKYFGGSSRIAVHDASCGYGALVSKLNLLGFEATGSDVDAESIELAKKRGNRSVSCGHFTDIPSLIPAGVEILTCYHSLEHYPDPLEFFRIVKRALRPGGLFLMAVPNGAYLPARVDYFGKYDWCFYPGHLQYFTPKSARVLLAQAGLRVIDAFSFDWDGSQEKWLLETASQLRMFQSTPTHKLLRLLGKRMLTRDLRVVAMNTDGAPPGTALGRTVRVLQSARDAFLQHRRPAEFPQVGAAQGSSRLIAEAICDEAIDEGVRLIGYQVSQRNGDYFLSLRWLTNRKLPADYVVVLHVQEFGDAAAPFVNLDFPPWPPTTEWPCSQPVDVVRRLAHPRGIEWRPEEARNLVHERPFATGKYSLQLGLWDLKRGLVGKLVTVGPITVP